MDEYSPPQGDSGAPPPASSDESSAQNYPGRRRDTDDDVEEELWSGTYSPKDMYSNWVLLAAITIGLFVVVLIWFSANRWAWVALAAAVVLLWGYHVMLLMYRRLAIHYQLTSQRFVHEHGVLRRVTDRIEVIDMDDISFEQSLIDRIFGVGSLKITSSDRSHPELTLKGIENVREVCEKMDKARRHERIRRGVHIEAV